LVRVPPLEFKMPLLGPEFDTVICPPELLVRVPVPRLAMPLQLVRVPKFKMPLPPVFDIVIVPEFRIVPLFSKRPELVIIMVPVALLVRV